MEHDASSVRSLNNISHYNLRGAGSEGRGNNNNNNINLHNNSSSSSSNPAGTLNASHMEFTTLKTELIDVSSEDLAGYNGRAGSGGDLSVPSSPVDMLRVSTIKSPLKSPLKSPRTLAALEGQDHLHTKSKLFPATATPAGSRSPFGQTKLPKSAAKYVQGGVSRHPNSSIGGDSSAGLSNGSGQGNGKFQRSPQTTRSSFHKFNSNRVYSKETLSTHVYDNASRLNSDQKFFSMNKDSKGTHDSGIGHDGGDKTHTHSSVMNGTYTEFNNKRGKSPGINSDHGSIHGSGKHKKGLKKRFSRSSRSFKSRRSRMSMNGMDWPTVVENSMSEEAFRAAQEEGDLSSAQMAPYGIRYVLHLDDAAGDPERDRSSTNRGRRAKGLQRVQTRQTTERQRKYQEVPAALTFREKFLGVMNGGPVTLFVTSLVLLAIGLTVAAWFNADTSDPIIRNLELFLTVAFVVEVLLRLYAMGPTAYLQSSLCQLDLAVTVLDITAFLLQESGLGNLVIFRVLRAVRLTKITKITRLSEHTSYDEEEDEPIIVKDEKGRIVSYDPDMLFSIGYVAHVSGTVLTMPELWIQLIFLVIITTLWAVNICPKECDPNNGAYQGPFSLDDNDGMCNNCVVGFDPSTGLMFASLVAFLLGLFDSMTFERWWATRVLLSQLVEELNTTSLYLVTYIPCNDEISRRCREQICRFLNLGLALGFKEIEKDDNFTEMVPRYISEEEWDKIQYAPHKYAFPYLWSSILVLRLNALGKIMFPNRVVPMLIQCIATQRTHLASIFMYMDSQIPYTYTHLMTLIVKVHLLFVTAVAGTYVGRGFIDVQVIDIIWGYLIILLSNTVLEGLLRIHVVLFDPFGEDACDFPVQQLLDYTWESSHAFLQHAQDLPQMTLDVCNSDLLKKINASDDEDDGD